jgi:putative ABC transport system permease protein
VNESKNKDGTIETMIGKILQKDLLRQKLITIVVFGFIFLSAMLVSSGCNLILTLNNSLDALFEKADVPHYVQMHAGELDQAKVERWADDNSLVDRQQTVEMLTIDGASLYLGDSQESEADTVMDISFVVQNTGFDFLLNLDSEMIEVAPGEIAVPIYFMQDADLEIGDDVRVSTDTVDMTFTVAEFVRDAQMNPAIVHSKRFVIHPADYANLSNHIQDVEYLVEFQLTDASLVSDFRNDYLASGMPKRGPAVDEQLFKVLNGLTDGVVAIVVIFLSILLIIIAILCLRFTILATLEEDYREIGVLKAVGISRSDIRRIYLTKYMALGALGSVLGYLSSLLLNQVLSENITLYFGTAPSNLIMDAIPLIAASSIFLIVTVSSYIVLRRFNKVSAVQALRSGSIGDSHGWVRLLNLRRSASLNLNIFLGVRDLFQRVRLYWLLGMVYFFCAVIIIIPVHFLTTIQSPTFVSYMGIGRSDMRIDLRQSDNVTERYNSMIRYLNSDPDVSRFAPLVTSQYTIVLDDGSQDIINIETGDFTVFPLEYVEGNAPVEENEIALSILNAQEMDRQVGDTITLLINNQEQDLVITGTYQDVTDGGRTFKANLEPDFDNILGYTVGLDLKSGVSLDEKLREYSEIFDPARVTDLDGYMSQTMGNTIQQMEIAARVTVIVGLCLSILVTSLFLNMLISKDSGQIAIKRSLGFSLRHVRVQYLSTTLFLLGTGIIVGTIFANTGGQQLVSAVWANMGASRISFVVDPLMAYIALPLFLIVAVAITTFANLTAIKATNIAEMINE